MSTDWQEHFEQRIQARLGEYRKFQDYRLTQELLLGHVGSLIASAERLIAPMLHHDLEKERRILEAGLKRLTAPKDGQDPIAEAREMIERFTAIMLARAEGDKVILEKGGDKGPDLVEDFHDLVDPIIFGKE